LAQFLEHDGHAAGFEEVLRDLAAAKTHIKEPRHRPLGDVEKIEVDARLKWISGRRRIRLPPVQAGRGRNA